VSGPNRTSDVGGFRHNWMCQMGARWSRGHTLWAIKRRGSLFVTITLSCLNLFLVFSISFYCY